MAALVALQQKTVGVGQTVEKCNNQPILGFIEPRPEHSFRSKSNVQANGKQVGQGQMSCRAPDG